MRTLTIAFLVLSLSACCGLGKKKSEASAAGSAEPATAAAPAPPKARDFKDRPTVIVDAKTLLDEYKNNEVRADGKYKDKIVQIKGKVGDVKKDITDSIYVTVGTGAMLEIPEVQCFVKDGETKAAAALNKGEEVTVLGHVDGLLMNVLVKDCVIDPDAKLCARFQAALGAGKCDDGILIYSEKPDVGIGFNCLPGGLSADKQKELYDKVADAFTKKGNSFVGSTESYCFATVMVDKGAKVPDGLLDRSRKALDAL